jgi:hypothetical protein
LEVERAIESMLRLKAGNRLRGRIDPESSLRRRTWDDIDRDEQNN